MKTKKPFLTLLAFLLTFTGLVGFTSTAFSANLKELAVGEMKNVVISPDPEAITDFSFIDVDGKTHQISDFQGKTILLNFWATWCGPCKEEMPSIDQLQAEMGSDKFEVLTVSHDLQGIDRVVKFFKALKIENLTPYNDKSIKSGRVTGVFGLPATLILNAKGEEVARMVGPAEWDSDEAKALLNAVIEE